jgi:hypothetical protein
MLNNAWCQTLKRGDIVVMDHLKAHLVAGVREAIEAAGATVRGVFGRAIGKDIVSRVWRKVKGDWDAWN